MTYSLDVTTAVREKFNFTQTLKCPWFPNRQVYLPTSFLYISIEIENNSRFFVKDLNKEPLNISNGKKYIHIFKQVKRYLRHHLKRMHFHALRITAMHMHTLCLY